MFVRTADERDLPAVSQLIGEAAHAGYDVLYGADVIADLLQTRFSAGELSKRITRQRSEFLVADDGSTLGGVAFGAAVGDDARTVGFDLLAVRPALQGRGIGGMLLEEFEQSFFESEFVRLDLDAQNGRALRFFEGAGYAEVERKTVPTIPATLLVLQKSLV